LRRKDGQYRWFYDFTKLVRNTKGELTGIRGYLYDQTLQKEAEFSLINERMRLANIIKGTNVGTWEWNVQTGETIFNERWAEIIGYSLAEISPVAIDTWMKFAHPDDLPQSGQLLEKHFRGEQEYYEYESRMRHKNGSWVWVLDRGKVATWTPDGKPLLMMGTHQDVTATKTAELELRAILETALDGFFVASLDGCFLSVNSAFCQMLGFSKEELLCMKISDVEANESPTETRQHIEMLVKKGFDRFETKHKCKDGRVIQVEISVTLLRSSQSKLVVFVRDITERKAFVQQLELAKTKASAMAVQAEMASKAKSEFLANMSHEIRTPLNGVIGFTDLLKSTPLNEQQQKYVSNANSAGHALLGIINDILDFSKIEAGMMELDVVKTDILELLESSVDVLKIHAEKKNIQMLLQFQNSIPRYAWVDPVRLKQILANLMGNALKFTHKGKVEIVVSFEPTESDLGTYKFEVRDTGIGISEEQKSKLFKAFSQADSSTTRKFGGTGLGLIISDSLAQKMGSKIQLESALGQGTTFYFELGAKVQFASNPEPQKIVEVSPLADYKNRKILIAEDVEMNMFMIRTLLETLMPDVQIMEARTGLEVVEFCAKHSPDLILMDVQMPEMDGVAATQAIRKLEHNTNRHVPIIALTAGAFKAEQEKCLGAGMDDFLTKPIEPAKVEAVLVALLPKVAQNQGPPLHFNMEHLLKRFEGNTVFVSRLKGIMIKDFTQRMQELYEVERSLDKTRLQKWAHQVKGAALNGELVLFAQLAAQLEAEAGTISADALRELLVQIRGEWDVLKELLA
jgi:PAS domain S-box-containing protein